MDIFSAARTGDSQAIQRLVASGAKIDEKNEHGHSPLMLAAYNGHFEATRLLLDLGANANSTDESSNSILMGVVFKGHTQIFEMLVRAGADLDYINKKNQSAMDLAIMFGRRNLIFRINQLQNSNRSDGRIEQVKTWVLKMV